MPMCAEVWNGNQGSPMVALYIQARLRLAICNFTPQDTLLRHPSYLPPRPGQGQLQPVKFQPCSEKHKPDAVPHTCELAAA